MEMNVWNEHKCTSSSDSTKLSDKLILTTVLRGRQSAAEKISEIDVRPTVSYQRTSRLDTFHYSPLLKHLGMRSVSAKFVVRLLSADKG